MPDFVQSNAGGRTQALCMLNKPSTDPSYTFTPTDDFY